MPNFTLLCFITQLVRHCTTNQCRQPCKWLTKFVRDKKIKMIIFIFVLSSSVVENVYQTFLTTTTIGNNTLFFVRISIAVIGSDYHNTETLSAHSSRWRRMTSSNVYALRQCVWTCRHMICLQINLFLLVCIRIKVPTKFVQTRGRICTHVLLSH